MTQRHRSSLPVALDVALYENGNLLGSYKTREVGFNSILLKSGRMQAEKHDIVDFTLSFPGIGDKSFCMKGIITDRSADTVRLTFTRYYPEYFEILDELLEDSVADGQTSANLSEANAFPGASRTKCESCSTRASCSFARMDTGSTASLTSIVKVHPKLRQGKHIFRIGEPFRSLYLVRSGTVKTWTVSEDGEEHILRFYFPGDVIGLGAIGQGSHDCNATTLDDGSLCEIPYNAFQGLAEQNPALIHGLMKLISLEIVHGRQLMKVRGFRSAPARLASFLNEISQNFDARGLSPRELNLTMARRDIADYLGLAEETVSRTFTQFQDNGMLEVNRKSIYINDREHLKKLCGARDDSGGASEGTRLTR